MACVRGTGRSVSKGRRALAAAAALGVATGLMTGMAAAQEQGKEQDLDMVRCESASAELRLEGCTQLILTLHDSMTLAWAFNNRGAAYEHRGQYDRAIHDYTEALKVQRDFAVAFFNRAIVYSDEGRLGSSD